MMCHRIGRPPISIIGFGRATDSSLIREPSPPARMTAFIFLLCRFDSPIVDLSKKRARSPRARPSAFGRSLGPVVCKPRTDSGVRDSHSQANFRQVRLGHCDSGFCGRCLLLVGEDQPIRNAYEVAWRQRFTANRVTISLVARSANASLYPISFSVHLNTLPSFAFL